MTKAKEVKSRNVLIAVSTMGLMGWQKRNGVFRYISEGKPWNIKLVSTTAELKSYCDSHAQIDGMIVSMPDIGPDICGFAGTDIPIVLFNINLPRTSSIFSRPRGVVFLHHDSWLIGETAANHLLSTGSFNSFAFLSPPKSVPWAEEREKAFSANIAKCGFTCTRLLADADPADAIQTLQSMPRPIGLFAASDRLALTAFAIAGAAELKIPEDISILGVDNDESICESTSPALSSISVAPDRFGYMAAKLLDELILRPDRPSRSVTVKGIPNVAERGSTLGTNPHGHLVERAIAYIRRHATDGIGPNDVAMHLRISRRLLDLRFSQTEQGTVLSAISGCRLEAVRKMLEDTSLTIDRISQNCGYGSPNHLMKVFKREFGLSMRDYRRQNRAPLHSNPSFHPTHCGRGP